MKILILGSGLVGAPMALDLANDKSFEVTIADNDTSRFEKLGNNPNIKTIVSDLADKQTLTNIISDYNLILNALPGHLGYQTLKTVIAAKKNIVDISFFPEDPWDLDILAKRNNVTAIMDCGVAPGMSYMLVGYVNELMDETTDVKIYVGGLPKVRIKPFEYKAVFSPIDVIEEYTRPARYRVNGQDIEKPALSDLELMEFEGIGTLEAFNSDGLRTLLQTIDCPNMIEKTLRYPGHVDKMKFLREIGYFSQEEILIHGSKIKPIDLTSKLLFPKWQLKKSEIDLTVMKVLVEGIKGGKKLRYTYNLYDELDPETEIHSMARTTGYTATMAVRMMAEKLYNEKGLIVPEYLGKSK